MNNKVPVLNKYYYKTFRTESVLLLDWYDSQTELKEHIICAKRWKINVAKFWFVFIHYNFYWTRGSSGFPCVFLYSGTVRQQINLQLFLSIVNKLYMPLVKATLSMRSPRYGGRTEDVSHSQPRLLRTNMLPISIIPWNTKLKQIFGPLV